MAWVYTLTLLAIVSVFVGSQSTIAEENDTVLWSMSLLGWARRSCKAFKFILRTLYFAQFALNQPIDNPWDVHLIDLLEKWQVRGAGTYSDFPFLVNRPVMAWVYT